MNRRQYAIGLTSLATIGIAGCSNVETNSPENNTTAGDSSYDTNPSGDAEVSLILDHGSGWGSPDRYELVFDVSHVEFSRANVAGGARYPIGEQYEFVHTPNQENRREVALIDQSEIPVGSYDSVSLVGGILEASTADGRDIVLPQKDRLTRSTGTVFEAGDHIELTMEIGLSAVDDGYELSSSTVTTLTW
ncbi:MAG: hypothetical protein U5K37_00665 [Natrialbaceae archaeon]|nr:hypothetical protein [Natrialbaceae archaeon]